MADLQASIERARAAYADRKWERARSALIAADRDDGLNPEDIQRLAIATFMLGDENAFFETMGRAHTAYLADNHPTAAIRCAVWLGIRHGIRGEASQAGGWLGRAGRLLEGIEEACVEQGYMLLPQVIRAQSVGDWDGATEQADRAIEIGRRFDDRDLTTLAIHAKGLSLVKAGRRDEGFRLLDEAMVAIGTDDVMPMVTGMVYCSVIEGCRDAFELQRATEWTTALAAWCEDQPDLGAFTGECLMYRADIMRFKGEWSASFKESERARKRFEATSNSGPYARACYQQAEVLRCRGDLEGAMAGYMEASRAGMEPQPGLALLRLAEGDVDAASGAIRRVTGETTKPLERARLLPAYVEITLAAGDVDAARSASEELHVIADAHDTEMLAAFADWSRGAVALAEGESRAALPPLRRAANGWLALDAPYEAARARELLAQACRSEGDHDTARLELNAAIAAYEALGANLDLERANAAAASPNGEAVGGLVDEHVLGLTAREIQVLRLVASGQTNRQIASELSISVHTVARHLQNIFGKIDVASRTEAAAFAYENDLT